MPEEILVSVIMITYNHENFIEEAINGVLMQKCDFEFELIVANDHSSDNSDSIILKILNENLKGNRIKYIYNRVNMGMAENFRSAFKKASGKYIAICEGDDYWTDALKLQKQVNFLEKNEDINVCFHRVNYVDVNNHLKFHKNIFDGYDSQVLTYEKVLKSWGINTCSIVFRRPLVIPSYLNECTLGDQPLCYFINLNKNFYYISDIMASYRITKTGFTATILKNELRSSLEFPLLDKINNLTNSKYVNAIKRRKLVAIMKDLEKMKHSEKYTFQSRLQFYIHNFHLFLSDKNGVKMAICGLFKYVI